MTAADLDAALALSQSVGWPHTGYDWRVAFELGRGVVAEEDGVMTGVMLWWPQGEHHATLGLAIVSERHQRRGIGRVLIDATLEDAGDRAISLCGTAEGLRLYERVGFVGHGMVHQHQGLVSTLSAVESEDLIDEVDVEEAIRLDHSIDGRDRAALIRRLSDDTGMLGIERAGELVGWSMCRPFGKGLVVGPVVASSPEDAEQLIRLWLERSGGTYVRVDTPSDSGLTDLLLAAGLPKVNEVVVMTRGEVPTSDPTAPARYALATQAFG